MKKLLIPLLLVCWLTTGNPATASAAEDDTFSASAELSQLGTRLKAESLDFVTTPFKIESAQLLTTLGVVAATGLTYAYDDQIKKSVQRNRSGNIDRAADAGTVAGDPFLHLGAALLLYGGGVMADSPRWKETGEMLGEALILADSATLILKQASGRGRPNATSHKGDFRPFSFKSDYDSLPSMHTASSFAFASVISRTSGSLPTAVASYCAATFVAYSRLNKNKHWASDVLLGAAIGELAGRVAISHHTRDRSYAIIPAVMDGGGGLALAGHF